MKLPILAALCLLGATVSGAQTTETPASGAPAAPWSVVGQWHAVHVSWTDTITISPDGTFTLWGHVAGRWTLTGLQDHLGMVLDWKDWPTETLTMTGPDDFRGKTRSESPNGELSHLTLHRIQPPVVAIAPRPPVETRRWHQGEPPIRLIRKDEGFCALSLVSGDFRGDREMVRVYVGDDGYWYLGGDSKQQNVMGECIVVRYPGK